MTKQALLLALLICLVACRPQPSPPTNTDPQRLLMHVSQDGWYALRPADLQAAGFATDQLDSAQLHLSQGDTAVPYLLYHDQLLFYGRGSQSRYSPSRPYLLQYGQPGQLISQQSATAVQSLSPATAVTRTLTLEQNQLYEARALTETHTDPWFWHKLGRGETAEIRFELPPLSDGSGQLQLQLWGQTHDPNISDDHDLDLLINGQPITTLRWDGPIYHQPTLDLPPGTLKTGSNSLVLSNEAAGAAFLDIMLLNWLQLQFATPTAPIDGQLFTVSAATAVALSPLDTEPLLFNLQNPDAPQQLLGQLVDNQLTVALNEQWPLTAVDPSQLPAPSQLQLARTSQWHNPEHQVDFVIITTDELAPALAPLVEARQAQGLSVAVVPVAEIYDAFADGLASPESIQQFLAYAMTEWQDPAPRYLLLVGQATTDYHAYNQPLPANHLPSLLVPVLHSGETVSDGRLADANGDLKPDLAVGRWPVGTVAEVEQLVRRTLAYETGTAVANALFIADASEAYFAPMSERLSQPLARQGQQLHGPSAAEVGQAWNQGQWLVTYIGHGSLELWGKENLFTADSISQLSHEQPPIVLQFTCLTGLFAQPGVDSLAEQMLGHGRGPVLTVAATSLTLSSQQEPFAAALLQQLADPTVLRMGDAFQQAKIQLDVHDAGLREISDTFVLLGDPTAVIVRPADP